LDATVDGQGSADDIQYSLLLKGYNAHLVSSSELLVELHLLVCAGGKHDHECRDTELGEPRTLNEANRGADMAFFVGTEFPLPRPWTTTTTTELNAPVLSVVNYLRTKSGQLRFKEQVTKNVGSEVLFSSDSHQ